MPLISVTTTNDEFTCERDRSDQPEAFAAQGQQETSWTERVEERVQATDAWFANTTAAADSELTAAAIDQAFADLDDLLNEALHV